MRWYWTAQKRRVIRLLLDGHSQRAAARMAGVHRNSVRQWLGRNDFQVALARAALDRVRKRWPIPPEPDYQPLCIDAGCSDADVLEMARTRRAQSADERREEAEARQLLELVERLTGC